MWRSLSLAAVIAALVAGCGNDDESGAPDDADVPSEQSASDLLGRSFTSTTVTQGGEPRPLVADTSIRVTFAREEESVVRFSAGCNAFGADVEITADRLLAGRIAGTDIGCSRELARQDRWLTDFFGSDPQWRLNDDVLALTSGETVVETEQERGAR